MSPPAGAHPEHAYLGLGANLGPREASVLLALRWIEERGVATVLAVSALYETEPVGMTAAPFVNAVARVAPLLSPGDLLQRVKEIEAGMGRRGGHYAPREIDIDIVAWGRRIIETPDLSIPHPCYADRAFVLVPLRDVAPEFVCPVTGATVGQMIDRTGTSGVTRISGRRLMARTTS
jgi:2-amino-4-hydroxy-6-hydroxymethyldihydropteridine diphosphokinase